MKLSVALIVKNEEALIEKCLESVKDADEIVVIDTGSEDDTVRIALKYTTQVFTDYVWEDHFANARNHAMSKCTGDWILSIDADDVLEKGGIEKCRKAIAEHPDELCFDIDFIKPSGQPSHSIPYLYKNVKEIYWKGAAHNYLSVPATKKAWVNICFGHSPTHKKDPDRTLRILLQTVQEDPKLSREKFYLAREYYYRKNWEKAIIWYDQYLHYAYWGPEMADAYLMKARCLWRIQCGHEARNACLQAIKINTNFKEALLFMAEMSGPINRENWLVMAEFADNSNVLFIRNREEKGAAYYEAMDDVEPRYHWIYRGVGAIIAGQTMLDIGCGQGNLSAYIQKYDGFDMIKNPYCVADIYTHDYGDYDVYVLLEVLEHLIRDIEVLQKIPVGKHVVFSVPSFYCPSHIRVYNENIIRWRYRDLIKLIQVTRFNFDDSDKRNRKWRSGIPNTSDYILLCVGQRI